MRDAARGTVAAAWWWNNYSPVRTRAGYSGDVLACVRFRMTPPTAAADNTHSFQLSVRGESGGMVMNVRGSNADAYLSTKTAEPDTWTSHAYAAFPMSRGLEQTFEMVLVGRGDDYAAELRVIGQPPLVLRAHYVLGSSGVVGMLGWTLGSRVVVQRALIGAPSARVATILDDVRYGR